MSFELSSAAFQEGKTIPRKHTCDGPDLSPPLSWTAPPEGTRSLALICDDPDAPRGTWVHWVIFDLPADLGGLPEGISTEAEPPVGGRQGRTDFGRLGYGGPCPPRGPAHRYYFRLYALDAALGLPAGATKAQVLQAMAGRVVAEAGLMGRYGR
jgi:Raf kinase inhibitor-like YbhB/YbcL family protein